MQKRPSFQRCLGNVLLDYCKKMVAEVPAYCNQCMATNPTAFSERISRNEFLDRRCLGPGMGIEKPELGSRRRSYTTSAQVISAQIKEQGFLNKRNWLQNASVVFRSWRRSISTTLNGQQSCRFGFVAAHSTSNTRTSRSTKRISQREHYPKQISIWPDGDLQLSPICPFLKYV
jgi:hypothetical protein